MPCGETTFPIRWQWTSAGISDFLGTIVPRLPPYPTPIQDLIPGSELLL